MANTKEACVDEEKPVVYALRGAHGRLLRVDNQPFEGMNDTLAFHSAEVSQWLRRGDVQAQRDWLRESDHEVLRVMEDVIALLIERGIIDYAELPQAARDKLDIRALVRADLEGLVDRG